MNINDYFYFCEVSLSKDFFKTFKDLIDLIAFFECNSSGAEEINIEEETVNKLLKEKAVGGGELPEEAILEVEKYFNNQETVLIKYFFEGNFASLNCKKFFTFIDLNITECVSVRKEKNEDWNSEWKKHYFAISVDNIVNVIPSFHMKKNTNLKNEIYIYPGMGFGTGSHETTFMCLQAFLEVSKKKNLNEKICLDFGCGSGILVITAMKYSSMICDFCDIDKNALDNCRKNILLNFKKNELIKKSDICKRNISLVLRNRFSLKNEYELVFANILENIILDESKLIETAVRSQGHVIISGILKNQIESIEDRFIKDGPFIKRNQFFKGEWAAILLQKK